MKFIKRILPVVLCGCMCLPMAACGDGSEGADAVNTSAARAAQLADNVFEKYIDQDLYTLDRDDADWELFVYDGYSHEYESGEGGASVWHYTAVYALANRMYSLYQGTEKGEEYKQLMDDLYEELAWYRGNGHVRGIHGDGRAHRLRGEPFQRRPRSGGRGRHAERLRRPDVAFARNA